MKTWGPWEFNAEHLTLENKVEQYYVSLGRCNNSAEVLDWIAQIAHKTWADDATVAHLVRALDDVLRLQQNYCGMSIDHKVDGAALARTFADDPDAESRLFNLFGGGS
ncbi:MAG: hypothetical protein QM639_16045 [Rhodocyclaceae bacterium]